MTQFSLKDQVIDYVKKAYEQKGNVPSITEIRRAFKISTRGFYQLFPKGIVEVCERAGVPPPRERVEGVEKALESRSKPKPSQVDKGRLASEVFKLLDAKKQITEVVEILSIEPSLARMLYEDWLALKEIDVNQPIVPIGFKAVQSIAESMYSISETIDQLLFRLGELRYRFFSTLREGDEFGEEIGSMKNQNLKAIGGLIKACKYLNLHLSASILKKSMGNQGFRNLEEFINDEGFEELGLTKEDVKDLGVEELEKTLEATPKDLETLGLKTDGRKIKP